MEVGELREQREKYALAWPEQGCVDVEHFASLAHGHLSVHLELILKQSLGRALRLLKATYHC